MFLMGLAAMAAAATTPDRLYACGDDQVRELRIVLGIVHAEAVFGSGSDDEFVDQRIAFALNLLERAGVLLRKWRAANGVNCHCGEPDARFLGAHRHESRWQVRHPSTASEANCSLRRC